MSDRNDHVTTLHKVRHVAEKWKVHEFTVRRMIWDGRIPADQVVRLSSRCLRLKDTVFDCVEHAHA